MKIRTLALLVATHGVVGALGFGAGIYALPILTAPPAPSTAVIEEKSLETLFTAQFKKELEDSDALHWGKEPFLLVQILSLWKENLLE